MGTNSHNDIHALRWRHYGRESISNHQPHRCLLNRLFRRRSKKTSKLRVTGLCAGHSPGTGEFRAQMASNAENVSIWVRHHGICSFHHVTKMSTCWLSGDILHRVPISFHLFLDRFTCIKRNRHFILSLYSYAIRGRSGIDADKWNMSSHIWPTNIQL